MSSAPEPKPTYADYLDSQGPGSKSIWVRGEIFAMSGASLLHNRIAMRLTAQLLAGLKPPCELLGSDQRLRVESADQSFYPDLQVACDPWTMANDDGHAVTNPSVVIEVLSPSTEAWDRGGKWEALQRVPSLRAYLVVSQEKRRMELYVRDGQDWRYTSYDTGSFELPLGATIDLDACYEGLVDASVR